MSHGFTAYAVDLTALEAAAQAPLSGPTALHVLCAEVGHRLPDEAMNPCDSSQVRQLKLAMERLGGDAQFLIDNLVVGAPPVPMEEGDFVATISAPLVKLMAEDIEELDLSELPRGVRRSLELIRQWYGTAAANQLGLVIIDS